MSSDSIEWFEADSRIARTAAKLLGLPHVPVKELSEGDLPFITAHLIALGPQDRRLRFGQAINDPAIAKYTDTIRFGVDGVFGVYDESVQLRAMCHLGVIEHPTVKVGELGLSVHPDFRGHGIGSLLFRRGAMHARNAGIERLFVHYLTENKAMLHIATKGGMKVIADGTDCEAHLQLPPANAATVIQETVQEQLATLDYIFKQQMARVKNWTGEVMPAALPSTSSSEKRDEDKPGWLPPLG